MECLSQWPRGLRRRSAAAHLLRWWVRIPQGAWMFVCCECCLLSGRGLCDELITRPGESYWLWCVVVCDLENLKNEEAMTRVGLQRHRKKKIMWNNNIRNEVSYFLPILLLFLCALLLTVVCVLCYYLMFIVVTFRMCIVLLCVYCCLTYCSCRIAG